jgi:hypothetical protein
MEIGLIDVDGHNFPNLALMKISAWHKAQGDTVEWWDGLKYYDRVYMSKVFDDTYTPDMEHCIQAGEVVKGGTGYGLDGRLPMAIEHIYPDYSLYPQYTKDTAYGFLTRGCPERCGFCCVPQKEGPRSIKVADVNEWWAGQKNIKLLDPNLLACPDAVDLLHQLADTRAWIDYTQGLDARRLTRRNIEALNATKTKMLHFAWDRIGNSSEVLRGLELYLKYGAIRDFRKRAVYVLTNFNTTMEQNLYRIYKLRDMGYDPYIMVYDKPNSPKEIRRLQRWVNGKQIFRSCERFEDYK